MNKLKENISMHDTQVMEFIRVKKSDQYAETLYRLLKDRQHAISHASLPTFEQHRQFVLTHPYRVWYIVKIAENYVGTIYILRSNTIGVNIEEAYLYRLNEILQYIMKRHRPLSPIESVRVAKFSINVSPKNMALANALEKMTAKIVQLTYLLDAEA